MNRPLIIFAGLNGAVAVLLGAFAAHGAGPQLKTLLTTGAHYQMVHALLAVACVLMTARWGGRCLTIAGWLAALGGMVFSLALAGIGLLSMPALGMVAPIGGLLMVAAWLLLPVAALGTRADDRQA